MQFLLSNALNSSLGIRQKPGFKGQKWSLAEVVELPVSISRETDERVVTQQDIKTWHLLIKLPTILWNFVILLKNDLQGLIYIYNNKKEIPTVMQNKFFKHRF